VRPDTLRSRAARGRARLRRLLSDIDDQGRLVVRGSTTRRAPGIVRVRMDYEDGGGGVHSLRYRARIRAGRWSLREPLPSKAARAGGHLSIQYTGDLGRRIRGEQLPKAVR
jgi:hypothetical protein